MSIFTIEKIGDDIIDVRDITARVEEIEETEDQEEKEELAELLKILSDISGNGEDHYWRGDWYPVTLIENSYFEDYAQEIAEELDLIPAGDSWPCNCIDWEQAAKELRMDYTCVTLGDWDYWYR